MEDSGIKIWSVVKTRLMFVVIKQTTTRDNTKRKLNKEDVHVVSVSCFTHLILVVAGLSISPLETLHITVSMCCT